MQILAFGNKNNKKIMLIHGFECTYRLLEDYIEHYKEKFCIIVPILPGHNPNKKEDFISFEESVKEIEEYYLSNYGNNLYAVYGMSMGGILAIKMLENKKINIEKVILESSPLLSYNELTTKILTKLYLMITHKAQKRNKFVINMAIRSIISKNKLDDFLKVIDNITDKNIINYVKEIVDYKISNNIDMDNTDIYYYHGTKLNELFAKQTAKYLLKIYPNSKIICFKGKGHCENTIFNSKKMIKELDKIVYF